MAVVVCTCRACQLRFAPTQARIDPWSIILSAPLVLGGSLAAWTEHQPLLLAIAALGLVLAPLLHRLRVAPCPSCGSPDSERRIVRYLTVVAGGAYQRR